MTKQKSHQTNRVLALGAAGIVRPLCVLLAGLLTGLLYLVLLAGCDIVPFGDNTWVMFDLKRQYIDFFSYYQRIFSGEEGILYSFQTALGSGMIGFFIYYLGNPLFLLLLPFRPDRLPLAVSFVIGVTLILAAMIMAAFLRWYLDEREPLAQGFAGSMAVIIGAVAWAFSGFLIAHSMNLMWTDVVIFVPVVIYALETGFLTDPASGGAPCLRSRFRALRYTLFIALILLWNYYISYQVLLFVAMWTLVRLWESRAQAPVRIVGRVAAHTFAAVGLDAVVLLPTLFELANSPKDIFQLGLETTGKTLTPVDVFSKVYVLAYDGLQPRFGYPQIYCGILMLLLAVLFFLDGRRTLRERIAAGIPLAVLMTSFCIDAVNLFWHALMEPSGHPYRQAPLYLFVALLCGVRYLAGICGRPPMPASGGEAGRTESAAASEGASRETSPMPAPGGEAGKSMLRMVLRYAVTLILAEGMFFLVSRGGYDYINPRMLTENAVRIPICLAGLFVCEWLSSREKTGREKNAAGRAIPALILLALAGMLGAELLVNADYTYGWLSYQAETRNHFLEEVDATGAAVAAVKAQDDGFYRMENLTPRQQNDAMMYGYNGVTHYSSAGMVYVRYLLHKLGYNDDRLYTHYGHDNTVTMDMLLGVRYLLSRDETLV
ncbi:MAG: YfhO family protein, partial [Lachnospiraceae bacterium]|nr:YfhO family protein [Lachnospiraceae bacterium]